MKKKTNFMSMRPHGEMPLRIGNLINTEIVGGSYYNRPEWQVGVNMAVEVDRPCDIFVPTIDYGVPEVSELRKGIVRALTYMMTDRVVYVGCFGGYGRTGIFLAALAKVQTAYRKKQHRSGGNEDSVLYVRNNYHERAMETEEQEQFIADFDVSGIVDWLAATQEVLGKGGFTLSKADRQKEKIDEMLDRSVPTGVITHSPDDLHPVYERHETIPPDFNPAWHRHRADWKEGRSRLVNELSEDTVIQDAPPPDWVDHFDSLQNQIDEIDEGVMALQEHVNTLQTACHGAFKACDDFYEPLTKPSWYEKIRALIGK